MMKQRITSCMLTFLLVLAAGCGAKIGTLTVRTWPGNAVVTINSVTDKAGKPKELNTDADGYLQVPYVKFPKGAQGPEPIIVEARSPLHMPASTRIAYAAGENYDARDALVPMPGRQTYIFKVQPADAKVYFNGVELPEKKYTFEFQRSSPAGIDDNPSYIPLSVIVKRPEYKDKTVPVVYVPGKSEVSVNAKLEMITEELITDYELVRPEPTDYKLVIRARKFWAKKKTSGDRAFQVTKKTSSDNVINYPALIRSRHPNPPRLMFTNFRTETGKVYANIKAIPFTGGAESIITKEEKYFDVFSGYDPDNRRILFSSNRYQPDQLLICSVDAENPGASTLVTRDPNLSQIQVNKEADGEKIVFTNYKKSTSPNIWYCSTDGSNMTQLCEGTWPRFSPGGDRILFIRYRYDDRLQRVSKDIKGVKIYPSELWVMNADGTSPTRLITAGDSVEIRGADWHKDGRHIVFSASLNLDSSGRPNFDIYIITDKGTELDRKTSNESCDDYPVWSEDGNYVFFRSNRGVAWNIWKIEVPLHEE